jgi:TRAP-type uncharacterized transport system substrate-binding protein
VTTNINQAKVFLKNADLCEFLAPPQIIKAVDLLISDPSSAMLCLCASHVLKELTSEKIIALGYAAGIGANNAEIIEKILRIHTSLPEEKKAALKNMLNSSQKDTIEKMRYPQVKDTKSVMGISKFGLMPVPPPPPPPVTNKTLKVITEISTNNPN